MITQAQLKQRLSYDPSTGVFRWRRSCRGTHAGAVAGNLQPNGYRRIVIDGQKYYAHRLAWLYMYGVWPPANIDHRHCKPDDNRIHKLRRATQSQNLANARRRSDNRSGYKGVGLHKASGLWRARIQVRGRQRTIGYYPTPQAAHTAYAKEARKQFGRFART